MQYDPHEIRERKKGNLVERASNCCAALSKSWLDGWGIPEHRCPFEESYVGRFTVLAPVKPQYSVIG